MNHKLPDAVLDDLMVIFLAGDASPETQSLIKERCAVDPEFAARLQAAQHLPALPATPAMTKDMEKATLENTQNLLRQRDWLALAGFGLSFAPLAFWFKGHELSFLLARDWRIVACLLLTASMFVWFKFFLTVRRLTSTGIRGPARVSDQVRWVVAGLLVGIPWAVALDTAAGLVLPASQVLIMAEWSGRFPKTYLRMPWRKNKCG